MKKRDDELTYEQKANSDRIIVYEETAQTVHLTLNRRTNSGARYFYNGLITKIHNDSMFDLQDLKTNEIYTFSIYELKEGGVTRYTPDESKW